MSVDSQVVSNPPEGEEYVERIILCFNFKIKQSGKIRKLYLVKWEGVPFYGSTCREPEEILNHQTVREFHKYLGGKDEKWGGVLKELQSYELETDISVPPIPNLVPELIVHARMRKNWRIGVTERMFLVQFRGIKLRLWENSKTKGLTELIKDYDEKIVESESPKSHFFEDSEGEEEEEEEEEEVEKRLQVAENEQGKNNEGFHTQILGLRERNDELSRRNQELEDEITKLRMEDEEEDIKVEEERKRMEEELKKMQEENEKKIMEESERMQEEFERKIQEENEKIREECETKNREEKVKMGEEVERLQREVRVKDFYLEKRQKKIVRLEKAYKRGKERRNNWIERIEKMVGLDKKRLTGERKEEEEEEVEVEEEDSTGKKRERSSDFEEGNEESDLQPATKKRKLDD